MNKETKEELKVRYMLVVLELAGQLGVTKICKEFDVPRSTYYRWKKKLNQEGRSELYRKKPVAYNLPHKTPPETILKILELRKEYQIGGLRIKYYLDRNHGIRSSESTVTRVLNAHGVGRLPKTSPRRSIHTKR